MLTKWGFVCIIVHVAEVHNTKRNSQSGPVVQSVSTPACHAGGRRFESVPGRHIKAFVQSIRSARDASVAQSVEQRTENPRVVGSIPTGGTKKCGCSSSGRAPPCQGGGSEFEPRHPLQSRTLRCSGFFIFCRDFHPDRISVIMSLINSKEGT